MSKKVVINKCYGGFGLSLDASVEYLKRKGKDVYFYEVDYATGVSSKMKTTKARKQSAFNTTIVTKDLGDITNNIEMYENDAVFSYYDIERDDPDLVAVVEKLGKKANGFCAKLDVVEIPDDVEYNIEEYDGVEWIAEVHRTWS